MQLARWCTLAETLSRAEPSRVAIYTTGILLHRHRDTMSNFSSLEKLCPSRFLFRPGVADWFERRIWNVQNRWSYGDRFVLWKLRGNFAARRLKIKLPKGSRSTVCHLPFRRPLPSSLIQLRFGASSMSHRCRAFRVRTLGQTGSHFDCNGATRYSSPFAPRIAEIGTRVSNSRAARWTRGARLKNARRWTAL